MESFLRWVGWNLFLAIVPVALGYALGWGIGVKGKRRLPWAICVLLGVAWLLFLPNTCYLLSEWRHLIIDPRWAGLLDAVAERDKHAMLNTAKWSLFFLGYSGLGVLCFVLSIRPLEQALIANGRRLFYFAPFLFFLTSLGVYLGLIVRLNSWDMWNRPRYVWDTTVAALLNPTLFTSIIVFALVLWLMYEAVDLWVEGVVGRLQQWGVLEGGGGKSRAPERAVKAT